MSLGPGTLVHPAVERACPADSGMRRRRCGIATRKVTVTIDEEQLIQIRRLVETGQASSVSGFVQHAVSVGLDDVAGWGALLGEALRVSGGPLTDEEPQWADEVLGAPSQPLRSGSAA